MRPTSASDGPSTSARRQRSPPSPLGLTVATGGATALAAGIAAVATGGGGWCSKPAKATADVARRPQRTSRRWPARGRSLSEHAAYRAAGQAVAALLHGGP